MAAQIGRLAVAMQQQTQLIAGAAAPAAAPSAAAAAKPRSAAGGSRRPSVSDITAHPLFQRSEESMAQAMNAIAAAGEWWHAARAFDLRTAVTMVAVAQA